MKKKDEIVLWPVYFDSTKTRSEGRRISKKLAMEKPRIDEIERAVEQMGFSHDAVTEARFPKTPWQETGLIGFQKRLQKSILKETGKGTP